MKQLKKIFAGATLTLLAYSPLSHAAVQSLPGLPEAGSPSFTHSAQVNLFNLGSGAGYMLIATNAGAPITFTDTGLNVSVSSSSAHPADFYLMAPFNADGTYKAGSGSLSISGQIPYPFANIPNLYLSGDLLTAKLENFAFNDDTLGFSIIMQSGFGTMFGNYTESVYLSASNLGKTLGFGSGALSQALQPIQNVSVVTTVPVPAAGWLLGSVLGVFSLLGKKRSKAMA